MKNAILKGTKWTLAILCVISIAAFSFSLFIAPFVFLPKCKYSFELRTLAGEVLISEQDCDRINIDDGTIQYKKEGEKYIYQIPEGQKTSINTKMYIGIDGWTDKMTEQLQALPMFSIKVFCVCFFALAILLIPTEKPYNASYKNT